MEASNVTDMLFKQLNFRGERQKVIASNIANLNTPGYKTKDIKFNEVLNESISKNDLKLQTTHSGHMSFDNTPSKVSRIQTYEVGGLEEQNDGNNVNLDQQMSNMAKNSVMFDALQGSIKKDAQWFKEIIAASGKN